jgi:hypothetical protein
MQNSPLHGCIREKCDKDIDRKRKELHMCVGLKDLVGTSVKWELKSPVGGDVRRN